MFSGNSSLDGPTESCCHQRDACYQICGVSKLVCDEKFKKCQDDTCASITDEQVKNKCNEDVNLSNLMLSLADCKVFDTAQRDACECVTKDKAADKREAAIRYFYKKFSPESLDKVSGLAKKADTKAKLAGLFQKLLLKYPEAIKKIKDPQAQLMEDLMNNMDKKRKTSDDVDDTEDEVDEVQEL